MAVSDGLSELLEPSGGGFVLGFEVKGLLAPPLDFSLSAEFCCFLSEFVDFFVEFFEFCFELLDVLFAVLVRDSEV